MFRLSSDLAETVVILYPLWGAFIHNLNDHSNVVFRRGISRDLKVDNKLQVCLFFILDIQILDQLELWVPIPASQLPPVGQPSFLS